MSEPPDVDAGRLFSPWTSMTLQEADEFLKSYRALLKAWTLSVGGFSDADDELLYRQLEEGQDQLADIALAYPERSYSVDMLINSRSRTWAGFAAERVPRPANRLTR
jgi:hypothetical protein